MNHIESAFVGRGDLVKAFGKDELEGRYEALLTEADIFIDRMGYRDSVVVNKLSLLQAVLDCYSDILRLKLFHEISCVAEEKMVAYEIYWILMRMPFQKIKNNDDTVFVNERFAVLRIIQYLVRPVCGEKASASVFTKIQFFTETLFYSLKYRPVDARSLELIILSFQAGLLCDPRQESPVS